MNLGKLSFYPVEGSCAHNTVQSNLYLKAEQTRLLNLKILYLQLSNYSSADYSHPSPPHACAITCRIKISLRKRLKHTAQHLLFY